MLQFSICICQKETAKVNTLNCFHLLIQIVTQTKESNYSECMDMQWSPLILTKKTLQGEEKWSPFPVTAKFSTLFTDIQGIAYLKLPKFKWNHCIGFIQLSK